MSFYDGTDAEWIERSGLHLGTPWTVAAEESTKKTEIR
jgi:hypothetical protein